MVIEKIDKEFTVCKVIDFSQVDLADEFCFIGKTDEECSLVCAIENVPSNTTIRDDGWKGFRVQGTLDFSLIGILSKIAKVLADVQISIFAISTYNTDYILVKSDKCNEAMAALLEAGFEVK